MITPFREAAARIYNPHAAEWFAGGGQIAGYTCSFMPPEIFHAAGILPYRLRGIETETMEIGDAYYGPYVCTFPKCLLQLAGQGKYGFLSGAVISTGCDAMRRLDECWRMAGKDYPDALPEFFHYFDVPHKTEPHALAWFKDEIRRLITAVSNHYGVLITDENLKSAISCYNRGRELLLEMESLRAAEDVVISGTDAFTVAVAGTVMPRQRFNEHLEALVHELRAAAPEPANGRKRILVTGSINDDTDLVGLIEDAGAVVVADNICFGIRSAADMVRTDGDPVDALAGGYLSNSVCPRMFGAYDQRFANLREKAARTGAEGVILQNIRFCDMHGSENSLIEKDFEAMGIPCLKLEREYGPLTETGRMKMRIEAFLEQLS
ncbi:benzoyl-CoA reductase/2-hydroxyglutaryl-CoA dehydratase subunit BcrC/BadD/HgdB [Desulfosalsimonas propionicica]|uniref:Benzoyl-CoA reductase/2-hydroxyglutaryl-CoA dehydratase subunit BcrC/BadD/HgdB n=1 Tax=Desulfosalsimonas propionicica TaxID=332175 RepID=A0A7W0HJL4_9BACT|nr:2-hydroxyacyl-CoA dehydratase family protein [Desulfosalsimonas propionicica]MBA2880218.1 benzoyl-CoA reductase/2-hydroxyglutaryl-CoA dehydratase subunit BcrC/BadD/HgdB [Desulfosalsimonas propionicica]